MRCAAVRRPEMIMEKGWHRGHHGQREEDTEVIMTKGGTEVIIRGGSLTLLASADVWDYEHRGCLLWESRDAVV